MITFSSWKLKVNTKLLTNHKRSLLSGFHVYCLQLPLIHQDLPIDDLQLCRGLTQAGN